MNKQLVIFTALDRTLLDVATHSFKLAEDALNRIRARGVPLIFCSSKTRSEQQYYQRQMGILAPMIVENGAAIVIPAGYFPTRMYPTENDEVIELGEPVNLIRRELKRIRAELNLSFRGYGELSLDELCHWTGLEGEAARDAQCREYSETIIGNLTTAEIVQLNAALQKVHLVATKGSRFYTVTSTWSDKGMAAAGLTELLHEKFGDVLTTGLGHSANDLPLLRVVDRSFLLRNPEAEPMNDNADWCSVAGPAGWAQIVHRLLDEHWWCR